jgi:hypothetical protein
LVERRVGARAAHDLGKWLYQHRDQMSIEFLKQRLEMDGLRAQYEQHYGELLAEIETDAALGKRLGVHYTPTFFVNGIQLPDNSARSFELAVQYEIERQTPPSRAARVGNGGIGTR